MVIQLLFKVAKTVADGIGECVLLETLGKLQITLSLGMVWVALQHFSELKDGLGIARAVVGLLAKLKIHLNLKMGNYLRPLGGGGKRLSTFITGESALRIPLCQSLLRLFIGLLRSAGTELLQQPPCLHLIGHKLNRLPQ